MNISFSEFQGLCTIKKRTRVGDIFPALRTHYFSVEYQDDERYAGLDNKICSNVSARRTECMATDLNLPHLFFFEKNFPFEPSRLDLGHVCCVNVAAGCLGD